MGLCTWEYAAGGPCGNHEVDENERKRLGKRWDPRRRCWRHEFKDHEPLTAVYASADLADLVESLAPLSLLADNVADVVGIERIEEGSAGAVFLEEAARRFRATVEERLRLGDLGFSHVRLATRAAEAVVADMSKQKGRILRDLEGTGQLAEEFLTEKARLVIDAVWERDYADRVAEMRSTGIDPTIDVSQMPQYVSSEQMDEARAWWDEYDALERLWGRIEQMAYGSPTRERSEHEHDQRSQELEAAAAAFHARWNNDPGEMPRPAQLEALVAA